MLEQGSDNNQSPQALNKALYAAIDFLPKDTIAGTLTEAQIARIDERTYSDYTIALRGRVARIIEQAPVTEYFKSFIVDTVGDYAALGIPPEAALQDENIRQDFFFLDLDNPHSGGIFDPDKNIRRRLEQIALDRKMQVTAHKQDILAAEKGEEIAEAAYASEWKRLSEWSKEIAKRYSR